MKKKKNEMKKKMKWKKNEIKKNEMKKKKWNEKNEKCLFSNTQEFLHNIFS